MTDQSVHIWNGRKKVSREHKQQYQHTFWWKLMQGELSSETLRALAEDFVGKQKSREDMLEELSAGWAYFREALKNRTLSPQSPIRQITEFFRQVGEMAGIPVAELYEGILERTVLESLWSEGSRSVSKPATRQRILDAALEVFSEKGFRVATMDEVADRAHVGKGTLYRHFENKEALFNELVRSRLEELEIRARAVLDQKDDVITMITKYLRVYCEFFDRNQRLYKLLVQERLDVGVQVQDLYFKKVMRRIPLLRRKIAEATDDGLLKPLDFQTVFYGFIGFMHGVIQKWLAQDCSYPLVDELPQVLEVLFYGFVNSSRNHAKTYQTGR